MEKPKIVFFDGYDEVRDVNTNDVVFSTKLPEDISKYIDRQNIPEKVIDTIVSMWNNNEDVDNYLLDEVLIYQDEREIIMESLYNYYN